MTFRLALITCALLSSTVTRASDWPGFRGPNRDGICTETNLLKEWPKEGPPLLWTAKNLGLGFGTPSIADGKIFGIGTRDGKDGVWALKESDGSQIWFTAFAEFPSVASQNNGSASTPTYHDGKVFTVSANGTLACMNANNGKLIWKKNYIADFGGDVPRWAYTDSVLVDGDKVICIPFGKRAAIAALKVSNGDVIWQTPINPLGAGGGYSSPLKATIHGVPMYIALLGDKSGLVGVDAVSGKVLWEYKGKAASGGVAQIPIPIVRGNKIWVSSSYGGGAALIEIVSKGKDAFEVKEIHSYIKKDLNNHHGGMVLVGDYIYFGHDQNKGMPVCVDFNTGEIKWGPIKSPEGGDGSAAVLYADSRLYFRYQNGVMVLIQPNPNSLKVVSSFKLPPPNVKTKTESWPHPVIADGKLYIRDQNVMYCYNIKARAN